MQDFEEDDDDLERMLDGEEPLEDLFAHGEIPCNGLTRQENIGNAQVFGHQPQMANQGKFKLWSSDVLLEKKLSMTNCASESLQRSQSHNQAVVMPSQSVAPKIDFKPMPPAPLIKVNFNNTLPPQNVINAPSLCFGSKPKPKVQQQLSMSRENIDDLLAEFDQEDKEMEEKTKNKDVIAFFNSVGEVNKQIKPIGFDETAIYPDEEVSDYYDSDEEELSLEDLAMTLKNREPPGFNDGVLRRTNAAIFMPMRLPSLYG